MKILGLLTGWTPDLDSHQPNTTKSDLAGGSNPSEVFHASYFTLQPLVEG